MTTTEFVQAIERRGVRLVRDGDRLHYEAPVGALTYADRERLRREKSTVLVLVVGDGDRGDSCDGETRKSTYARAGERVMERLSRPSPLSPPPSVETDVATLEADHTAHFLRAEYDRLTANERQWLADEADGGDAVAVLVVAVVQAAI